MACVAAASVIAAYDGVVKPLYKKVAYDDTPPIVFLDARLQQTRLPVGAKEIEFSFVYTKRDHCHPPLSPPALIKFRIWHNAQDWVWLRYENQSYAAASATPVARPFRAIPIPPLQVGTYAFQWTATYHCSNSSGPITVESPKLPFEIVEPIK